MSRPRTDRGTGAKRGRDPRPPLGGAARQQRAWDARAAANFACGGAGSGLVIAAALAQPQAQAALVLFGLGLALVGAGLLSVWLEIGKPLRALHVFLNPRRSWMSRESLAAVLLVPAAIGAALGVQACGAIAGAVALAFLFCQARILSAARGIPAWREPMLVPLILATGLTEGAGLLFALEPWLHAGSRSLLALFGALVLARLVAWLAYRRRVAPAAAAQAVRTLDRAGAVLQYGGTLPPLVLVALVAAGAITGTATQAVAAVAGASAVLAGAFFKIVLVTQAGHTQAVALPHLPVRGRRVEIGSG